MLNIYCRGGSMQPAITPIGLSTVAELNTEQSLNGKALS